MSDEMDAMMADGLLHTVRECARHLYGENQIYPCDDVKRMMDDVKHLRKALRRVIRVADRDTDEFNEARAALGGSDE